MTREILSTNWLSVYSGRILPMHKSHLRTFQGLARIAERVPAGDFVECGVGRGRTFLMLAALAQDRKIHGFDSFKGFPPPTREDASSRNPRAGEWGFARRSHIEQLLRSADLSMQNVRIYSGFFENTLDSYTKDPIALLHLDVDLYTSYKQCLNVLAPFVVPGGVIIFDEYRHNKWPGATKAIDEFLCSRGLTAELDTILNRYVVQI